MAADTTKQMQCSLLGLKCIWQCCQIEGFSPENWGFSFWSGWFRSARFYAVSVLTVEDLTADNTIETPLRLKSHKTLLPDCFSSIIHGTFWRLPGNFWDSLFWRASFSLGYCYAEYPIKRNYIHSNLLLRSISIWH